MGGMLRCTFEQIIVPYNCDHNHMVLSFAFGMFESVFEHTIEQDFDQYHMIISYDQQPYDTIIWYRTSVCHPICTGETSSLKRSWRGSKKSFVRLGFRYIMIHIYENTSYGTKKNISLYWEFRHIGIFIIINEVWRDVCISFYWEKLFTETARNIIHNTYIHCTCSQDFEIHVLLVCSYRPDSIFKPEQPRVRK
jgi:hypothetical protein